MRVPRPKQVSGQGDGVPLEAGPLGQVVAPA
jgi:hypothetical protein